MSYRISPAAVALTCLLTLPACARQPTVLTLTPAPVSAMRDDSMVAVKGQVAEIFGNKFILQDNTGRTLVETGPRGDDGKLVAKSAVVTVQGRFEHGFIHAQVITLADGTNELLGPSPGGPRPPHNPGDCPAPVPAKAPAPVRNLPAATAE